MTVAMNKVVGDVKGFELATTGLCRVNTMLGAAWIRLFIFLLRSKLEFKMVDSMQRVLIHMS
jgi:hypothetical protein